MFYLHFFSFPLHGCLDFNLKPSVEIVGRDVHLASVANVALVCVLIVGNLPPKPKGTSEMPPTFLYSKEKDPEF